MRLTPPVRVACVGAGYFSRFHYDGWNRIKGVEPVASINRDVSKAKATGWPAYGNLTTALEETKPDLLDIITPPLTHMQTIRDAISHGIRVIICQKPFCLDLEEAREAVELARDTGTTIIVHENFRFQPWYRVMRREMENGRIGKPLQISFFLRTGDGQGPEAYLDRQPYFQTMPRLLIHETGVHFVDVFRFLAGEPTSIYADLRKLNPVIEGEDAGHFIFGYESGLRALFDGNRLLDHAAENHRVTLGVAQIEGTEGSLNLAGDGSVTFRPFDGVEFTTVLEAKSYEGFGGDCVFALQQHVIEGITKGTPLENQAADYLRNLEIVEAIYDSNERSVRINV